MEFLLAIFPPLVISFGLSIIGLWWLLSDHSNDDTDDESDNIFSEIRAVPVITRTTNQIQYIRIRQL